MRCRRPTLTAGLQGAGQAAGPWLRLGVVVLVGVGRADAQMASDVARVAEFSGPYPESAIRVAAEPSLVIGDDFDHSQVLFAAVDDAAILPSGTIVALEGGGSAARLYLFAPDGRPLRTLGRSGEGPGEFVAPYHVLALPGDTLLTWDDPVRQLVWFHPQVGVVRQEYNRTDPASPHDGAILPDGSRLIRHVETWDAPRERISRYPALLKRFARDSVIVLGAYPSSEMFLDANGFPSNVPFPKRSLVAGGGPDQIVVAGDSQRWEVQVWTYDGTPLYTIRRAEGLESASRAQRARARERFFSGPVAQMRGEEYANRVWRDASMGSRSEIPAFTGLWVDAMGLIWVGLWNENDTRGENTHESALVFEQDGVLLGRVPLPTGVRIFKIYRDYLVGRTMDDWGVQRVVTHAIER